MWLFSMRKRTGRTVLQVKVTGGQGSFIFRFPTTTVVPLAENHNEWNSNSRRHGASQKCSQGKPQRREFCGNTRKIMTLTCVSFLVLLFLMTCMWWGKSKQTAQDTRASQCCWLLSWAPEDTGPWGLSGEDWFSREANRNLLHCSEGKVNFPKFQYLRELSHKKRTAKEAWVSILMMSILECWLSQPSPHFPLMPHVPHGYIMAANIHGRLPFSNKAWQ